MKSYAFGPYVLRTSPRQLLREGSAVQLGGRALAILHALVEHRGETLSKQKLMQLVWPHTVVGDGSLHVHVNTLRKRIGRDLVTTVAGEGYRLSVPVRLLGPAPRVPPAGGERARLVGRANEAAELTRLLQTNALVTVVGQWGVGKSALARSVAEAGQGRFAEGVGWVDVTQVADDSQLVGAVTAAAQIAAGSDQFDEAFAARQLLLVLDNADRRPAAVASLCGRLRANAPGVAILATSQVPLRVAGESVYRIVGLAVPRVDASIDEIAACPSVQLFAQRADQAIPGFVLRPQNLQAVAHACRFCDGVPLAIEIIAAQIASVGTDSAALERSLRLAAAQNPRRDAPDRQQTLRSAIEWSLRLLPPTQRDTLLRLAVFEDRFDLSAAHAVLATTNDPSLAQTQEMMTALVASANVIASGDPPRYRLVALTRVHLLAELESSPLLHEMRRRHADYFAEYAHALVGKSNLKTAELVAALDRVAADLVAALRWSLGEGHSVRHALSLCGDLYRYWDAKALFAEAGAMVDAALALEGADAPELSRLRLAAVNSGAMVALYQGDHATAEPRFREALALARADGNALQEAWALQGIGASALQAGQGAEAVRWTTEALLKMDALGDSAGIAACQNTLVLACIEQQDLESAHAAAHAALVRARNSTSPIKAAFAHGVLGHVLRLQGDYEQARGHMQAALVIAIDEGVERGVALARCGLAWIHLETGDPRSAAREFAEGLALFLRANVNDAMLVALIGAAGALLKMGRPDETVLLLAAIEAARESQRLHLSPYELQELQQSGARAQMRVGKARAEVVRTQGRLMPLRAAARRCIDALNEALAPLPRALPQRPRVSRAGRPQEPAE